VEDEGRDVTHGHGSSKPILVKWVGVAMGPSKGNGWMKTVKVRWMLLEVGRLFCKRMISRRWLEEGRKRQERGTIDFVVAGVGVELWEWPDHYPNSPSREETKEEESQVSGDNDLV